MDFREEIKPLVDHVRTWASTEPMTPLQRILALYDFKDPDRVPGGFAMWSPACIGVTEVSAAEYHTDPYKFFYTQLTALNRYRHDLPILFSDVYNIEPEACGSKVMYPEHSMPEIRDFAIKEPRDLDALKVPDPHRDGRMPYILEICRLYHEHLSDLFFACPGGNAPFSMAVGLRGYRNLVRDMKNNPDFAHRILEFCTNVIIDYGKAMIDECGWGPTLCDAYGCIPNVTPAQVDEFVLPYAARCLQVLKKPAWFYAWGFSLAPDWVSFVRKILAAGEGTLILMEEDIRGIRGYKAIDLPTFKRLCALRRVVLFTCLQPDTMFQGPPQTIQERVKDWITKAAAGSGLGFYTSIPYETPPEHVRAYVESLRLYGRYPIAK